MALYVLHCTDKPGHAEIRLANRGAHLEFLKGNADKLVLAGPLLTPDEQGMVGSLLVLDLPDLKAAYEFAANDPYAKAGLFESVTIRPYKKVLPA